MTVRILTGDCRDVLKTLPDQSVHCCVTSPPYWGLREYGTATWEGGDSTCEHVIGEIRTGMGLAKLGEQYRGGGHKQAEVGKLYAKGQCPHCGALRVDRQIGLEPTPAEYVAAMVQVFREVWRVLRDDGTCWINLGDGYNNFRVSKGPGQAIHGRDKLNGKPAPDSGGRGWDALKEKDLMMMPARVALALQADGWTLRSDIIWSKANPMPESVRDRPTTAHEHVFLLTKGPKYFYDATAIEEDQEMLPQQRLTPRGDNPDAKFHGQPSHRRPEGGTGGGKRNKRSVWWIATQPFAEAHFATFPPALIEPCILAGTSERGCCPKCGAPFVRQVERIDTGMKQKAADGWDTGPGGHGTIHRDGRAKGQSGAPVMANKTTGWLPSCSCDAGDPVPCTVLDCFGGAATSLLVADRLGRDAIGIELNPEYVEMARSRLERDAGMFSCVEVQRQS